MPDRIAATIEDRSAKGIAAGLSRLITAGDLAPGSRLPTVRELARRLGTSPTTVSEAWRTLARTGAIESRGRLGTFVVEVAARPHGPRRYRRITEGPGTFSLDLSTGTPDPELLPDLRPVLATVSRQNLTTSYLDDPVLPALDEALRERWPFDAEALTVVDGALDALDRLSDEVVRLGDRVLVENPAFPPLLDLLEQLGAEVIGLELDEQGIVPESLRAALAHRPVALFLQPRAQNPCGCSTTQWRARQLAAVLKATDVIVIEDDHSGDISSAPLVSLGRHLPHQTVLIRSFSKSHGPDLRLAAIGGAGTLVRQVAAKRILGPGWSSRLLQSVLVAMLDDPATIEAVQRARDTYADRRDRLVDALGRRGVLALGSDGINVWVEVTDEQSALITLASLGIGAAPGEPFLVDDLGTDHLRVTVSAVRDVEALADALTRAAGAAASYRRSR